MILQEEYIATLNIDWGGNLLNQLELPIYHNLGLWTCFLPALDQMLQMKFFLGFLQIVTYVWLWLQ